MASYVNPGYAFSQSLEQSLMAREAAKERELQRQRLQQQDALAMQREQRIAQDADEARQLRQQQLSDAEFQKGVQRTQDRINSMLPGDYPDPELINDAKKYGLSFRLQTQSTPDYTLDAGDQGPVPSHDVTTNLGTPEQREVKAKKDARQKIMDSLPPVERRRAEYADIMGHEPPNTGVFHLAPEPGESRPDVQEIGGYIYKRQTDGSWVRQGPSRDKVTGAQSVPLDPVEVESAANIVLSGKMAPSQAVSAFGGMGVNSAAFKRAMNLEIVKKNPTFNFIAAESNYQHGKNAATQSTIRYIDNIQKSFPAVKRASDAFKHDTSIKLLNRATITALAETGDVNAQVYLFAMNAIGDELAKTLQGGSPAAGTSDAKMAQALDLFDKGMTPDQLDGVMTTAQEFLHYRRESLAKGTYMEQPEQAPAAPTAKPSAQDLIKKYSTPAGVR